MTEFRFSDRPTVELVDCAGSDRSVLRAMLVSTLSDTTVGAHDAPDYGRINFLMKNRHGSPFEHNMMTFRVEAPIAVFREWHRHRIGWSYNEQSGRYTKFEPHFYVPGPNRPMKQVGKVGAYEFVPLEPSTALEVQIEIMSAIEYAWKSYERLLELGAAKEVARGVLPVYTMSTMYATCNARSLMAFLSLRRNKNLAGEATFASFPMWEIDDAAEQMEDLFAGLFPLTYAAYINNGRIAP